MPFFKASGLSKNELILLFLVKLSAGMIYGWTNYNDTWFFFGSSLHETQLLVNDPATFIATLFNTHHDTGFGGFLSSRNSWWNTFHSNAIIKLLAVFNFFSFCNYNVNVIFYSFLSFFGPVALYRLFLSIFPKERWAVLAGSFLFPSFLYWTSGFHKDGIVFLGIALTFFFISRLLANGIWSSYKNFTGIAFGLACILVFRNYILLPLLPAAIAWIAAHRSTKPPILIFASIYAFFSILFFLSPSFSPKLNLPQAVVEKQEDFMTLRGRSYVPVKKLQPNLTSFIENAPLALQLALLRPFPSDSKDFLSKIAVAETLLLMIIALVFLLFGSKERFNTPFILCCLFFSISLLLIIGYTVNFLGAIVRYRSIVLPILFIPMLAGIQRRFQ